MSTIGRPGENLPKTRKLLLLLVVIQLALVGCEEHVDSKPSLNAILMAYLHAQVEFFRQSSNNTDKHEYCADDLTLLRRSSKELDATLAAWNVDVTDKSMRFKVGKFDLYPVVIGSHALEVVRYIALVALPDDLEQHGGIVFLVVCSPDHASLYSRNASRGEAVNSVPEFMLNLEERDGWHRVVTEYATFKQ